MIAKVAVDLPLEEPFDYLIPPEIEAMVAVGVRVKVSFGPRIVVGFVVGIAQASTIEKIKTIKAVIDATPIFDYRDLDFARVFAGYYGCCLGEVLMLMTRHRRKAPLSSQRLHTPQTKLYHCIDGNFVKTIADVCKEHQPCFILVADAYAARVVGAVQEVGMRKAMFEAFTQQQSIVILEEADDSFKQEQSPKYETRQVLLMAQAIYGFDLIFISQTPSVELFALVDTQRVAYERRGELLSRPMVIDVTNYKFLDKGILSVPVRNALENNIKTKQPTLVYFNRRGTFSVTRCGQCGYILKCARCDSAMSYDRKAQSFVCRQCQAAVLDAGDCPTCHGPAWKSFGMGIEKVHKEIGNLFPTAKIVSFDGTDEALPSQWDVLIATSAILRLKHRVRVASVVVIEIDSALNRLDIRSSFKTWGVLNQLLMMGKSMLVQTRNLEHPMLKAFVGLDHRRFYAQELSVRKELELSPYFHWAAVVIRAKSEKNALGFAQAVYNQLSQSSGAALKITAVMPDNPAKLRDQYRFRLMAGGQHVPELMERIKQSLRAVKRVPGVIVTFDIDP